ncbi:uncharacterized protein EV422DRAFT_569726 [Fimicolochytrium jonesii]|uniref:uncharacterized protein n=1 Tax=Fimicolochytrium jonesii TaxID=1396493 RepID=UPI0022FF2BBF|nr:uncharacterized protein EV422DRAFT_569726 [Fimicolochytrium jonesii]KAI8818306.1 hypothetical protein EV422DRAFT_569726 [Fimicolochytrium jonesii]
MRATARPQSLGQSVLAFLLVILTLTSISTSARPAASREASPRQEVATLNPVDTPPAATQEPVEDAPAPQRATARPQPVATQEPVDDTPAPQRATARPQPVATQEPFVVVVQASTQKPAPVATRTNRPHPISTHNTFAAHALPSVVISHTVSRIPSSTHKPVTTSSITTTSTGTHASTSHASTSHAHSSSTRRHSTAAPHKTTRGHTSPTHKPIAPIPPPRNPSTGTGSSSPTFSKIVVIGDSASDTGNLFKAVGVPVAPYYEGRLSNGKVWAEFLAEKVNAELVDLAFAGAAIDRKLLPSSNPNHYIPLPPDFHEQVTNFLNFTYNDHTHHHHHHITANSTTAQKEAAEAEEAKEAADPAAQYTLKYGFPNASTTLYVVYGGGNDYIGALTAAIASPVDPQSGSKGNPLNNQINPKEIVQSLVDVVTKIRSAPELAAQHILVGTLPDLAQTPLMKGIAELSKNVVPRKQFLATVSKYITEHNKLLTAAVKDLTSTHPNPGTPFRIDIVDVAALTKAEFTGSAAKSHGFTNINTPCLSLNRPSNVSLTPWLNTDKSAFKVCRDPDTHAFWDTIHRPTRVHKRYADAAWDVLSKTNDV